MVRGLACNYVDAACMVMWVRGIMDRTARVAFGRKG